MSSTASTGSSTGVGAARRRRRRRAAARAVPAASLGGAALETVEEILPRSGLVPDLPGAIDPPGDLDGPLDPDRPRPAFAHASEAEMARILDFYRVRWEYEPHVFPILWNLDGAVVESFSPDFWLPDLELYLEMTTLRQKLVRKKNRKLRRVRELYPDLRIKLFYARDFRALMLKFGRLALFAELAGTSGQVVPERPAATDPVDPDEVR